MTDIEARTCLQCGETPEAIKREQLFCGIVSGYEYRELEYEWPRHRWADWRDSELARRGIKPEAYDKYRRTLDRHLDYPACEDTVRGHIRATEGDVSAHLASYVGQCIMCGGSS